MTTIALFAALALATAQGSRTEPKGPAAIRAGVCEMEARKLVGVAAVRIGKGVPAPKRIRYANPKYPDVPPGTLGSGMWLGEFLVGLDGTVVQVWTIREVRFDPPFPPFNQAIVDSILASEYEPLKIDGRAVPFCVTATANINWS